MVLHGIGGRTIAEAKQRMSYAEAMTWFAYRRKHGPFDLGQRMELGFAMVATMVNRAAGGKVEITDLMPHHVKPEPTIEDVAKLLGARRKG